jgi:hypothetical protein
MNTATRANKDLTETSVQDHLLKSYEKKMVKDSSSTSRNHEQSSGNGQTEGNTQEYATAINQSTDGQFMNAQPGSDETNRDNAMKQVMEEGTEWKPVTNLRHVGPSRYRMSMELPKFDGTNGQDVEEWLMTTKFIMEKQKVPKQQQLHAAVCQLEGPAFKLFYRNQSRIQEWEALERILLQQFPPAPSNKEEKGDTAMHSDITIGRTGSKRPLMFAGDDGEDAGEWVDQMLNHMEQLKVTPADQREWISKRLTGRALMWYRVNRLNIPNMEVFIKEFLSRFTAAQVRSPTAERRENCESGMVQARPDANGPRDTMNKTGEQGGSSSKVLQAARNEKAKTAPNFSGSENSSKWIRTMEQTGKSLQLNDQQIYELATIKLTGAAQEWFCQEQEDERIENWEQFKRVFLYAFPPPIEPTNVDYLHQLLSRKQGTSEPVGKFVQEINRLCLKLDRRIEESEKLQYLRRGLRPQLQQHALSITSVQEFLTIMQRHEQIEKEMSGKQQMNTPYERGWDGMELLTRSTGKYRPTGNNSSHAVMEPRTQALAPQAMPTRPLHQTGEQVTQENTGYHGMSWEARVEEPLCYGCKRPGHFRRQCPEYQWNQQEQENFHGRGH